MYNIIVHEFCSICNLTSYAWTIVICKEYLVYANSYYINNGIVITLIILNYINKNNILISYNRKNLK